MEKAEITANIKKKAFELGYDLCGVIDAGSVKEYVAYLDKRVGQFPNSRHLYEKLYNLGAPEKREEWAKSVVVCVRRYNKYRIPRDMDKIFGKIYLFDGRLSCSNEYRAGVLFEEHLKESGFRCFRDFVAARFAAVKSGLGYFGKNNFLYTQYGSWVWIDTWTVDRELDYDQEIKPNETCPDGCRRCIDACPTGALSEPFAMDRGLCIAHLSFYSTELPPEHLREKMGTWLYGCDVCQDVCPRNKGKWVEEEDFPDMNSVADLLSLEKILEMDETTFHKIIHPRFWYIGKDSIWLWKCNVLRAMANSQEGKYHSYLKKACMDEHKNVRDMANWACEKSGI